MATPPRLPSTNSDTANPAVSGAVVIAKENQQLLKGEFTKLQMLICEKLQTKQINMPRFLVFIKGLFHCGDFIPASERIDDIFEAITHNGLWDYINYRPLQQITKAFARDDEEINTAIHEYCCALAGYLAATKLADHIASVNPISEDEEQPSCARLCKRYLSRLTIKIDMKATEESLNYIIELRDNISEYLALPSSMYVLLLDEIHEGYCSLLVPTSVMPGIVLKVDDPDTTKFFSKLGISRIEMDDLCLYEEEELSVGTAMEQNKPDLLVSIGTPGGMLQDSSLEPYPDSQEQVKEEASQKETAEQEQDSSSEELRSEQLEALLKTERKIRNRTEEENIELRAAIAYKEVEIGKLKKKLSQTQEELQQTTVKQTGDVAGSEVQCCKRFSITKAVYVKHIGDGAFGEVVEVQVNTKTYAAKMFHDAKPRGQFLSECFILSNLQHPHVVYYCSLCYTDEAPNELLLMMEKLDTSLRHFLMDLDSDLNLQKKLSILKDVASGLEFLHQQKNGVVIHRDLTANNVLLSLTPKLVAKIADFGNARVVQVESGDILYTKYRPGTLVYMPPEVLGAKTKYSYCTKLDIFSFGHLALFTAIQISPDNLLDQAYSIGNKTLGRSEVERRGEYFSKLLRYLGENHALVVLIKQCLRNDPEERPSATTLHKKLVQVMDKTTTHEQTDSVLDSSDITLSAPHTNYSAPNSSTSSDTEPWPDLL